MAIAAGDIKIKLSTRLGSAGNTLSQGNVNNSLGKYISTTELVSASANNLFDDVTGAQNAASQVDYRCIFIHNSHATITYFGGKIYFQSQVSGGTTLAIAIDNVAASPIGGSSAQAADIAVDTTTPTGVGSFSSPSDAGSALSLGDIPAGQCRAVWVRRTAANTVAVDDDGGVFALIGDTTA